jgi:hypothetical protein
MRCWVGKWLIMMSVALVSTAGRAAAPLPRWDVESTSTRCNLTREDAAGAPGRFIVEHTPGAVTVSVMISRDASFATAQRGSVSVQVLKNTSLEADVVGMVYKDGSTSTIWMPALSYDLFRKLGTLHFLLDEPNSVDIDLTSVPADILSQLQTCEDSRLTEWGVSPMVFADVAKLPEPIDKAGWLTASDYPLGGLSPRSSGLVVAKLMVGRDGRVSDCTAAVSSGDGSLDARTCSILLRRGRYAPAVDNKGHAEAVSVVEAIRWSR